MKGDIGTFCCKYRGNAWGQTKKLRTFQFYLYSLLIVLRHSAACFRSTSLVVWMYTTTSFQTINAWNIYFVPYLCLKCCPIFSNEALQLLLDWCLFSPLRLASILIKCTSKTTKNTLPTLEKEVLKCTSKTAKNTLPTLEKGVQKT